MSQRLFIPLDEDSLDCEREFDLTKMSAMEYLKGVRFERKTIPQIVTVRAEVRANNPEGSGAEKTFESSQKNSNIETSQNTTKEWRELQKEKFAEMQLRVDEMRLDPSLKNRLTECEELTMIASDDKSCIAYCQNNDPMLSRILGLNQGQLEELIEILSAELSSILSAELPNSIASLFWITKWIYALLACLRSPLDPEVHNCLRMIAKSCIQVTSHMKSISDRPSDLFLPWNLITVVIALNFQQFDLLSL